MFKKSQVEEGIATVSKLLENGQDGKKNLFESEGEKITLQISGIKLPRINDSQIIKIRLPHTPMPPSRDICLIVKDLEKGIKPDHEATVEHFQSLLADKGINQITQVISLRELKVEYKQYEAKTQLCHRFDLFLADARIIRLLPQFLGKPFYKRKKLPIQVDLNSKDLKGEVERAVMTVTLPLKHTGSCSSVSVGYISLSKDQLLENTLAVLKTIVDKYPGGWPNVRSVYVKSQSTPSLPLYVTLRSANDLGKVESSLPRVTKRRTVTDELSTVPGATVTVTPYGSVRVKRTADPDWDVDNEEPILEKEEKDEEEKENMIEEEKKKAKEKKVKKQKTEKGKQEKEDSDSEDEIENAELEYMKKVAEEEEEMEKKLESNESNATEVKSSGEKSGEEAEESEDDELGEEEEEEEEDADDNEDAVNLLGDDEDDSDDEDSDNELNLQDADLGNDPELQEEASSGKKKKTKKLEKSKSEKKKEKKEKKNKVVKFKEDIKAEEIHRKEEKRKAVIKF